MRRRIEGRERLFAVRWTAILLTACVCIVLAGLSMQKAQDLQRNICILFENEPISGGGAQAIRDAQHRTGDAADFVVWQEYKNRSVTNEQLTGAVFTNVLEFSGSPALLLPKGYLLGGNRRKNGCLIGEKTAQELFEKPPCGRKQAVLQGRGLYGARRFEGPRGACRFGK